MSLQTLPVDVLTMQLGPSIPITDLLALSSTCRALRHALLQKEQRLNIFLSGQRVRDIQKLTQTPDAPNFFLRYVKTVTMYPLPRKLRLEVYQHTCQSIEQFSVGIRGKTGIDLDEVNQAQEFFARLRLLDVMSDSGEKVVAWEKGMRFSSLQSLDIPMPRQCNEWAGLRHAMDASPLLKTITFKFNQLGKDMGKILNNENLAGCIRFLEDWKALPSLDLVRLPLDTHLWIVKNEQVRDSETFECLKLEEARKLRGTWVAALWWASRAHAQGSKNRKGWRLGSRGDIEVDLFALGGILCRPKTDGDSEEHKIVFEGKWKESESGEGDEASCPARLKAFLDATTTNGAEVILRTNTHPRDLWAIIQTLREIEFGSPNETRRFYQYVLLTNGRHIPEVSVPSQNPIYENDMFKFTDDISNFSYLFNGSETIEIKSSSYNDLALDLYRVFQPAVSGLSGVRSLGITLEEPITWSSVARMMEDPSDNERTLRVSAALNASLSHSQLQTNLTKLVLDVATVAILVPRPWWDLDVDLEKVPTGMYEPGLCSHLRRRGEGKQRAYDLSWLKHCKALIDLRLTGWIACQVCWKKGCPLVRELLRPLINKKGQGYVTLKNVSVWGKVGISGPNHVGELEYERQWCHDRLLASIRSFSTELENNLNQLKDAIEEKCMGQVKIDVGTGNHMHNQVIRGSPFEFSVGIGFRA